MWDRIVDGAKRRPGTLVAACLAAVGLVGAALIVSGLIAGDSNTELNGWTVVVLVGMAGWLIRLGYRIGTTKVNRTDERLEQIELRLARMHAELIDRTVTPLQRRPGS